MVKTESPARIGRPRDPDKDEAVLFAARTLLAEVGYQQTTISAIARTAGVNTPAIYRRWSSREALIEEAVHGPGGHPLPRSTGDLRVDLTTWVHIFLVRAADPRRGPEFLACLPIRGRRRRDNVCWLSVRRFVQRFRICWTTR